MTLPFAEIAHQPGVMRYETVNKLHLFLSSRRIRLVEPSASFQSWIVEGNAEKVNGVARRFQEAPTLEWIEQ
jgi:hypothetical protein